MNAFGIDVDVKITPKASPKSLSNVKNGSRTKETDTETKKEHKFGKCLHNDGLPPKKG